MVMIDSGDKVFKIKIGLSGIEFSFHYLVHIRPEGDFFVTKKSKKSADGDLSGMFCYL